MRPQGRSLRVHVTIIRLERRAYRAPAANHTYPLKEMHMLSIVQSPDPLLNTVCEPCDFNDKSLKRLAKQMAHVMYKNAGCGLAAPQVGVLKRLVVIDCDRRTAPASLSSCSTPSS